MAPNASIASLNQLIQLILDKEKSAAINTSFKKRLQSTIFFPPQSEPSFWETSERWNRVLERRRIENQEIVAQELEKRDAEIQEIARTEDSQLWKNLDSIRAFLLELHSPPSLESYNRAREFQRAEDAKLQVETQAELDRKLYQVIMQAEPLVGEHWQTDIYAGSSSSLSDSTPSSDWNSDSEEGKPDPASDPEERLSKSITTKEDLPKVPVDQLSEPVDLRDQESLNAGVRKLEEMRRNAYWLKSETEIANTPLPELIAIREVLAALLNTGGRLIYNVPSNTKDPMTLSAHVPTLLDKSRTSSLSLLSSFLPVLSSLRKLRQLTQPNENHLSPGRKTLTEEAFADAVLGLLTHFDVFLTSIELELLNLPGRHTDSDESNVQFESVFSLMRLHYQLDQNGWIVLFTALADAVPDPLASAPDNPHSLTKLLMDNLYRIACQFDSHCKSANAVERVKVIFLRTCEPVWRWVGDWIIHGRLPASPGFVGEPKRQSNEEFFIQPTGSGGTNTAENWWEDRYVLKPSAMPEFLNDFVANILEAGKATALSRILDILSDKHELPDWPKLEKLVRVSAPLDSHPSQPTDPQPVNILRLHLRHLAFSSRSSQTVPRVNSAADMVESEVSFHQDLYSQINQHLSPLQAQTHSRLHTRFSSPLKLSSYLKELNEFFLLGSQASVQFLKKTIEDASESSRSSLLTTAHLHLNSTNWWDDQVMNGNLSKALEYAPSSLLSASLPKLQISPSIRTEADPLKCLESIHFSLAIPTPLNYVLDNAHVMKTYNDCFVFLAQLARASWTLDSLIWIKPSIPFGSFAASKQFEQTPEAKEFCRLKNRLAWFVNLISDYAFNSVIFTWKIRFIQALDLQVGDLSQTIRNTRHWLARLAGLMFLSEQCQSLNKTILQVLQLCTRVHEVWTRFNRQVNTLKLIEDISETYVNTERRRRRIERRKRRMRNEQYSLLEEESRHIDPLDVDSMVPLDAGDEEHEEDPELDEQTGLAGNLSSTTSLDQTAQNLLHLVGSSVPDDDFLEQLQSMNLEFEKLLLSFQRAIGKLCRTILLKSNNYFPSTSSTHPDLRHQPLEDSGFGLEGSQDLDTLTLLECRLDEWIT
ncbi:hypothetical protein PGT21_026379 [Puccinia graminis f. sp. tritici]|uniref:Spindle pole body component n=2 Tax=Puccinia graminis f. sp. tritici TaxID=56615 RepID=A0A5B0M5K4_PUCGR|nr:hypothetical protein PGT21_026379 [Puccinia graminis f. sp. tritici]